MPGPVPTVTALQDIYRKEDLVHEQVRWNTLREIFVSHYNTRVEFVVRSPGRVNIIGEHIDYSLYSCLPMAIDLDVIIGVSTNIRPSNDGTFTVKIANEDEDRFPKRVFKVPNGGDVEIDATSHDWTNYVKAGLRGALQLLRKKHGPNFEPKSMNILVDGCVPLGGGVSSSAALVSASALAVMIANGEKDIDKKELTEVAIVSERAVGVNSGGMDQSASIFSERGSALFVSFTPTLSARPVFFPKTNPELCFMVVQSFVTSNKQETGPIHYNLRVVECSMAAAYLNAKLCPPGTELPKDAGPLGVSLHGFHDNYFKDNSKTMPEKLEELIELTKTTLTQEKGYTLEEVASGIGISVDELKTRFMSSFPVRGQYFKLRQRALHVFTEALRVLQFLSLLEDPAKAPSADNTLEYNKQLGNLLNETQDSCRDLYECSCPEIDQICKIARDAGSYGSRLTGAGWGGCTVHLVPVSKVDAIEDALVEKYFSKRNIPDRIKREAIIVSEPMNGSAVYMLGEGKFW